MGCCGYALCCLLCLGSLLSSPCPRQVVCATIPKSGTHLLQRVLEGLLHVGARWLTPLHTQDPDLEDTLRRAAHPLYITHLFPMSDRLRALNPTDFAKIVLIRDPRDVMVSFTYHLRHKKRWVYPAGFSQEAFLSLSFQEQLSAALLYPCFNPIETFPYVAAWMADPSILVCRFEDLVGPEGGGSTYSQVCTLLRIASHIGVNCSVEEAETLARQLFGRGWTFRAGQIGEWRRCYTEEHRKLFNHVAPQAVAALGYEELSL